MSTSGSLSLMTRFSTPYQHHAPYPQHHPLQQGRRAAQLGGLDRAFTYLEAELKKKTFLVGHRVTLADLTVASNLAMIFVRIAGTNFRSKYPNTVRYYNTVVNQPKLLNVFKGLTFAEDNVKFTPPKKEEKPKAALPPRLRSPRPPPFPRTMTMTSRSRP